MEAYKITEEIRKRAASLHEALRNYGGVSDIEKTLIVSACMLTAKYIQEGKFDIKTLTGDIQYTDGNKIYDLLISELTNTLEPENAKVVIDVFSCLSSLKIINNIRTELNMTPLKYFLLVIKDFVSFCVSNNITGDYLGIFYSEFMSYSGSDRQSLGIVLTPHFITELFQNLCNVKPDDIILDPCFGTGAFLVSALNKMESMGCDAKEVCSDRLYGYDIQANMYAVAMTNLIINGCATDNLKHGDFLGTDSKEIKAKIKATVGFMNPPYAQGKKDVKLTEINFIKHLLDSLTDGARAAVIVPASAFTDTKKTNPIKEYIYEHHTLEGVITLNENTFLEVGTYPVIAVFTAGIPHPEDKIVKFINFEDDGYVTLPNAGRIYTDLVSQQREKLLLEWNSEIPVNKSEFCIRTKVKKEDEWLHGFYYSNLTIPDGNAFATDVASYLSFMFDNILKGRGYLFDKEKLVINYTDIPRLSEKIWKAFDITDVFEISGTMATDNKNNILIEGGNYPRVSCSEVYNACIGFYSSITQNGEDVRINKGNVITVESASSGAAFYQPFEFISTSHVTCLKPKEVILDQYVGLFLTTCIKNTIKNKYNYGYKCSIFRLEKNKILLPIDNTGSIDYGYMRAYIINMFNEKLAAVYSRLS